MPERIAEKIRNVKAPVDNPIASNKCRKAVIITVCILTIAVLSTTIGTFGSRMTVAHADSVKSVGVGIYWDQNCTSRTHSLAWGPIEAGSDNTITVYIKNECTWPVSLSLETANWTPSVSREYISLNWNYSNQILEAEQVISVELTLSVTPKINGFTSFGFNTIVTANECY
jgi:hypothetical protein